MQGDTTREGYWEQKDGLFQSPVALSTRFCPQVSRSENKSMNWIFTVPESVGFLESTAILNLRESTSKSECCFLDLFFTLHETSIFLERRSTTKDKTKQKGKQANKPEL